MTEICDWDLEHDLDEVVRLAIYHTMIKLYRLGIDQTRLGMLMRELGIDGVTASRYDDQIVRFDVDFIKYVETIIGVEKLQYTAH